MNGHKAFIVAEMSANHVGDIDIAKKIIDSAKKSGCDAVKIQTEKPDRITIDCDNEYFKVDSGTLWDGETLYDLYSKTYLPWEWHKELFDYARNAGIVMFSTPFDETAVDLLEECNNPIYKIASFEMTDIPLIKYAASKGKPMIISNGISDFDEIREAIEACYQAGNRDVTVLQCTSQYPASLEKLNLATMVDIKEKLGVKVGFSDHTTGITAAVTAVALGASVVEKHFTLDRNLGGPDAAFSAEPDMFREMIKAIRECENAIGKVSYELDEDKKKNRKFGRSLFVVKDVRTGDRVTRDNVRSIRPIDGMAPKFYDEVLGKRFEKDVERGTPLSWDMISETRG